MQGKIIRGIAGFYYVHVKEKKTAAEFNVYECKAKGQFRNNKEKPLVGDDVVLDILDEDEMTGNIVKILPRKNALIRPEVANVDQALVIFSLTKPEPNFNLLDRFLLMMQQNHIPSVICFNKEDLVGDEEADKAAKIYESADVTVLTVSARENKGLTKITEILKGKTTTVAGPSGVGKSSIINRLQSGVCMETGDISKKIDRGKHTTRHSELISIDEDTYILDTPGFSSLAVFHCEKEEVKEFYHDFDPYFENCRFRGCMHINEPGCAVKDALLQKKISEVRYKNYLQIYEECSKKKRY